MENFTKTKIVATIGPSSSSYEMLKKLAEAGMNVARINFSHGSHDDHKKVIDNIRKLNTETDARHRPVKPTCKGPKIRTGVVEKRTHPAQRRRHTDAHHARNRLQGPNPVHKV